MKNKANDAHKYTDKHINKHQRKQLNETKINIERTTHNRKHN